MLRNFEMYIFRLIEMRAEIEELQGTKNQLERICFSMADDIRTLKMKMDQQSSELGTVSSELKNKSKKLEDDNRNQVKCTEFSLIDDKHNVVYSSRLL